MKTLKNRMICLFLLIAFTMPALSFADNFTIMSEEYPPYNYTEGGKLTGLSTEITRMILEKVGHADNIKVLPWSRSYNLIQQKDNHILFSMTRTEAREDLFKWVGPVAENNWVFYAKKGSGLTISSLDDAKKVKAVGTYKDDAAEMLLKEKGFSNLDSVLDDSVNVLKLVKGRIDLWITGDAMGMHKARKKGLSDKIENIFEVKKTKLYIAFSKNTPDAVIQKWQKALDELKADGSYDKILSRYL